MGVPPVGDLTTRYAFMDRLHDLLLPQIYLEIGVQYGYSLRQARPKTWAIGIDPEPLVSAEDIMAQSNASTTIHRLTSDQYFATDHTDVLRGRLGLAFIDGMHWAEYAWRDLINIEPYATARTVVAIDDVLPYSPAIAERTQPPGGDWTGDVWKILPLIQQHRPHLKITLVDCFPVGLALVYGFDRGGPWTDPSPLELERLLLEVPPPDFILERKSAVPAATAISLLREELGIHD